MIIKPQPQYSLLDSGDEMKLEKYGDFVVARPDPQAIWSKKLDEKEWSKADATYVPARKGDENQEDEKGKWVLRPGAKIPKNINDGTEYAWPIELGLIKIYARLTAFKHTGIFPEQLDNWLWIDEQLKSGEAKNSSGEKLKVLNLFGYTGGASIVAAKAGAEVTHVDASRAAITWARENMLLTGLDEKAIRWMLEDAVVFVKKELRRGNKYDAIIMDPPIFGRGAKGEVWKIEEDLRPLVDMCFELLSDTPLFFILNGYSAGYSSISYANLLDPLTKKFEGIVEHGELLIEDANGRQLPSGIVARFKRA